MKAVIINDFIVNEKHLRAQFLLGLKISVSPARTQDSV